MYNDTLEESKDASKRDVSFNTLLDDSTLSFNPDAESPVVPQRALGKPSLKEQKIILELNNKLNE